jgi:hypothetical protein
MTYPAYGMIIKGSLATITSEGLVTTTVWLRDDDQLGTGERGSLIQLSQVGNLPKGLVDIEVLSPQLEILASGKCQLKDVLQEKGLAMVAFNNEGETGPYTSPASSGFLCAYRWKKSDQAEFDNPNEQRVLGYISAKIAGKINGVNFNWLFTFNTGLSGSGLVEIVIPVYTYALGA